MQEPDFWKDRTKAVEATKELSDLQEEVAEFEAIKTEDDLRRMEFRVFLSGAYDKGNAFGLRRSRRPGRAGLGDHAPAHVFKIRRH